MKKSSPEIALTQAQIASACGISQPTASRDLRGAGIEPGPTGYTLSDVARLAAWRALEQAGASSDGRVYDVAAERGRLLANQADLAKLKIDEARRELIPAEQVKEHWCQIVGAMRARLLGLPSRLAAVAIGEDRVRIQQHADAIVRECLTEISRDAMPPAKVGNAASAATGDPSRSPIRSE